MFSNKLIRYFIVVVLAIINIKSSLCLTFGPEQTTNLTESRAYVPDAQYLDFVYHDHEEMTKFLR